MTVYFNYYAPKYDGNTIYWKAPCETTTTNTFSIGPGQKYIMFEKPKDDIESGDIESDDIESDVIVLDPYTNCQLIDGLPLADANDALRELIDARCHLYSAATGGRLNDSDFKFECNSLKECAAEIRIQMKEIDKLLKRIE